MPVLGARPALRDGPALARHLPALVLAGVGRPNPVPAYQAAVPSKEILPEAKANSSVDEET